MKKIIAIALSGLILTSCAKDVEVCIDGNLNPSEPGTYTYTWCGQNADNIEWRTNWGGSTLAGESVNLTFDQKGIHTFSVWGFNKKKEEFKDYSVQVGAYEARIEPKDCDGLNIQNGNIIRAYLYSSLTDIEADISSGIKTNSIDSIDLEHSYYYNGTNNNSVQYIVGGFQNVPTANYHVFIEDQNSEYNNLVDIIFNTGASHLNVQNGELDDVCFPVLNTNTYGSNNDYLKNIIGKTWLLTETWVNSTQMGVSACNADDQLSFGIDGTFLHDVGADDCSGGQANSAGTFALSGSCTNLSTDGISLYPTSGSFNGLFVYLQMESTTVLKISYSSGGNYVEQEYTAQ